MTGSTSNHSQFQKTDFATRFPDYEDVVELGRGGMGVVYKARHKFNGHNVVIKTMLKNGDGQQIQRFQREATVLAELKHHNIVSIKNVGQSSGECYFAMEYIEGQNLRHIVAETLRQSGQVPDFERTVAIILATAKGLAVCHEKGIVHRDVKPENIVIGQNRPVLVDFGLVKQMDSQFDTDVQNLTKTGQMLGTPGFMPPEQLEFNGEYGRIGPASDVWSLGATLYYCLSGQQPFGALPFSAWCMAVVDRNPPPVKTLNPELPDWLSELCSDCLERKTSQRPTMLEFCKRMELREKSVARQPPYPKTLVGLVGLIIVLVACVVVLASRDREAPEIALRTAGVLISTDKTQPITISGFVIDRAPAWIIVNKKRYRLSRGGAFNVRLKKLKEGEHRLSIVAEDESGNVSAPITVHATVDRTSPGFSLKSVTVENNLLKLDGKVTEKLSSLMINGQRVEVTTDQFRHDIPLDKVTGDLQFVLIDENKLRTTTAPTDLFVISSKNSRYSSLRQAIQRAPLGSILALPKGRYRSVTPITRKGTILGLGSPEDVILEIDRPILLKSQLLFYFKGLSLVGTGPTVDKMMVISESSNVTIEDCILKVRGFCGIEVNGYSGNRILPSLTIRRSKLSRSLGPAISTTGAKLVIDGCEFTDPGPSLNVDQSKAFACVEMSSGSEAVFKNSRFFEMFDRGILLSGSTGTFTDCEFKKSICEGAVVRSRSTAKFLRCQFVHNNYSGVTVSQQSSGDFIDCEFRANGFPNSPNERKNGLRVLYESQAKLNNCSFSDHYSNGLVIVKSKVNIFNCKFKNNKMGDIKSDQATITRKPPSE
ncbi:MAG: protein kinase [Planctomycetota bacterium]|nr:protein kinase [Planctomycetota bacterium]